jgi:hypothetical protein
VIGSTTGAFTNPSAGSTASGLIWQQSPYWTVAFNDVSSFNYFTPISLSFGSITLTNLKEVTGNTQGSFTAELDLSVNFTTPSGHQIGFADGLGLVTKPGSGNGDTLNLAFSTLPTAQTFNVGAETYTVSYDGFFASNVSETNALTGLSVSNRSAGQAGSDSQTAYLWGSISSTPPAVPAVPEPASVLLLGTVSVGVLSQLRASKRARKG